MSISFYLINLMDFLPFPWLFTASWLLWICWRFIIFLTKLRARNTKILYSRLHDSLNLNFVLVLCFSCGFVLFYFQFECANCCQRWDQTNLFSIPPFLLRHRWNARVGKRKYGRETLRSRAPSAGAARGNFVAQVNIGWSAATTQQSRLQFITHIIFNVQLKLLRDDN